MHNLKNNENMTLSFFELVQSIYLAHACEREVVTAKKKKLRLRCMIAHTMERH